MSKLTQEVVRELLDYNPETGFLYWRERDLKWFKSKANQSTWNKQFAGKRALTTVNNKGYLIGFVLRERHKSHRIIHLWMTGKWPNETDHENGIVDDNRWENLRSANKQENSKNRSTPENNTSGRIGVYWHKPTCKWTSRIKVNGISKYLGLFETFEAACEMRGIAERNYGFHPNHGRIK